MGKETAEWYNTQIRKELAREREELERIEKYEREKWLRDNTSQGG